MINDNAITGLINSLSQTLVFCEEEKNKVVKHSSSLEDYDDDKKEEIEQRYEEVNNIMQSKELLRISLTEISCHGNQWKITQALRTKSRGLDRKWNCTLLLWIPCWNKELDFFP